MRSRGRQNKFFKRCQLGLQTGLPLLRHFFHQPLDASWLTIHGKNVPSAREQFNSLCAIATAKVDGLQGFAQAGNFQAHPATACADCVPGSSCSTHPNYRYHLPWRVSRTMKWNNSTPPPNETVEKPLVQNMFIKISHNRLCKNCQNVAEMLCGILKTRHFSAFLSHFSKIIFEKRLFRQFQRLR